MNQKQRKGYCLHDARIAYSGGTGSIRTIKYELLDPQATKADKLRGTGLQAEVTSAIISDYNTLYGTINFKEYLSNTNTPSLIDFWLSALSLGFVFSNQNSIKSEFLSYLGQPTTWQTCYDNLSTQLKNTVDPTKFQEFLIKSHRGIKEKNTKQRQAIILNLLQQDADPTPIEPIADDWANNWSPDKNQLTFKCDLFKIPTPAIDREGPRYSFALDPSFTIMDTSDKTQYLDQLISYYETKSLDPKQIKRFLAIGDNGNYFSGVFGNLLPALQKEDLRELAQDLNNTYNLNNETEIHNRLTQLKLIADQIKDPKLVRQWSDYRSDFNGTIESWYSNRDRNKQEAMEQFFADPDKTTTKVGIMTLLSKLTDLAIPTEIKDGILQATINHINSLDNNPNNLTRDFTNELNNYYLPTLRDQLNTWTQADQSNKNILPNNWYDILRKKIQQMPQFFGENKFALWKQLINLKQLVRTEISQILDLLAQEYQDYPITEKQIDMLAQLYLRIRDDGNQQVLARLQELEKSLRLDFTNRTPTARYYLSGFERGRATKLPVSNYINISQLLEISDLQNLLEHASTYPQDDNTLRDVSQLSKIITSAIVRGTKNEKVATLAHSNLSGYASLLSKTEYVSRSTIQAVNGEQLHLGYTNNRYYYSFNPDKFKSNGQIKQFKKSYNYSLDDLQDKPVDTPMLGVNSSKYQIQFLEWFMGKHKHKTTRLQARGAFSIAEELITIDWSQDKPLIKKVSTPRVFVSQPFEIIPPGQGTEPPTNRFLGIDIGEYGLAWSLIEVEEFTIKQLESGFISDPQQQTLKQATKNWRQSQAKQTFTSTDTYIAHLRDSLIGSYRNQLESLAMRKKARLSFEYEVSSFETGSNRIVKVYDSIKRGDIRKKENNSENKMAWGDKGANIWGFETTAAGTSQTCSKCHRWASLDIKDEVLYSITPSKDGLFKTKIGDKKEDVRLLTKKDTPSQLKGKDLRKLIYQAMRPNEDGLGIEIVKQKYDWNKLNQTFGVGKPRGNMAIFVCPYLDCQHISDADLQAAFTIAVRGYLKSIHPDKAKKKGDKGLSKEFLTTELQKYHFESISLTHSSSFPE